LPNTIQYIKTCPEKLLYWKSKLSHLKKYKVGIVYKGLLSSFIEKNIPLQCFETLCDLDVDFICIHKKSEIENDLNTCSFANKLHTFDLDVDIPFEDTIHLLKNIDLLITIDTSIVHLAGVLGVKTWLLLGYSEWRWSNVEDKTYWYDSVELVRTTKDEGELKNVIPRVKSKLHKLLKPHTDCNL
jgi:ADP-heptose:LPS heptosyltransferase